MTLGRAFVGFQEADISFPPTFKYDVLRTLKHHRTRPGHRLDRLRYPLDKSNRLTEVEEKELEKELAEEHDAEHGNDDGEKESDGEGEGESASLASSAWTSMHSRAITDQDQDDDYFGLIPTMIRSASAPGSRASLTLSSAAHKAKTKWRSLLSPTVPSSPTKWLKRPLFLDQQQQQVIAAKNQTLKANQSAEDLKLEGLDSETSPDANSLHTTQRSRVDSSKSHVPSDEDDITQDKGVYDSSHKKRVPSW